MFTDSRPASPAPPTASPPTAFVLLRHRTIPTMLNPAVRVLWRGPDSVQLELGQQAVVLDGIAPADLAQLAGQNPTSRAVPRQPVPRQPVPDQPVPDQPVPDQPGPGQQARSWARPSPDVAEALLDGGYLWPAATPDDLAAVAQDPRLAPPRPRLAAELGALIARFGEGGAEILHARRYAAVVVQGGGRVASQLAALLAAAGIGRVHLADGGEVHLHQTQPGGVVPDDEGRPLATAGAEAIRRAAPDTDTGPLPPGERPDLVVLAEDRPVDPELHATLHARGWSHVSVSVGPDRGVVGPLVIPGLTSCLRCLDMHRCDRDARWPALAVQLSIARRRPPGSDAATTSIVAGVAAMQALTYLDGGRPATLDGTVELHHPDWRLRRRSWPAHPDCGCHEQRGGDPTAAPRPIRPLPESLTATREQARGTPSLSAKAEWAGSVP